MLHKLFSHTVKLNIYTSSELIIIELKFNHYDTILILIYISLIMKKYLNISNQNSVHYLSSQAVIQVLRGYRGNTAVTPVITSVTGKTAVIPR